eukprot:COSAG04_NODE_207_length_20357_cov_14.209843_6_plen_285_part_00
MMRSATAGNRSASMRRSGVGAAAAAAAAGGEGEGVGVAGTRNGLPLGTSMRRVSGGSVRRRWLGCAAAALDGGETPHSGGENIPPRSCANPAWAYGVSSGGENIAPPATPAAPAALRPAAAGYPPAGIAPNAAPGAAGTKLKSMPKRPTSGMRVQAFRSGPSVARGGAAGGEPRREVGDGTPPGGEISSARDSPPSASGFCPRGSLSDQFRRRNLRWLPRVRVRAGRRWWSAPAGRAPRLGRSTLLRAYRKISGTALPPSEVLFGAQLSCSLLEIGPQPWWVFC